MSWRSRSATRFFVIAMFVIVAGIFFVLGRPLPIPNF